MTLSQCRNTHPVYGRCQLLYGHQEKHTVYLDQEGNKFTWYTSDGYEPSQCDDPPGSPSAAPGRD